jgi:hypothetical protein
MNTKSKSAIVTITEDQLHTLVQVNTQLSGRVNNLQMQITSLNKALDEVNEINEKASVILVDILKSIKNGTPIQLEMLDGVEEIIIKKLESEVINISYNPAKIEDDVKRAYKRFLKMHDLWINDKSGLYKAQHDAFIIKNFDVNYQKESLRLIRKDLDIRVKASGLVTRIYNLNLMADQWRTYSSEERECIEKYAMHHITPVSFEEFLEDFKNIFSVDKKPFSKIMTRLRHLIALNNANAYLENDENYIPTIKMRSLKTSTNSLKSTAVSVE